jgi:hypothetical protein
MKPEAIICLGKQLNDDGSLDWVSQERVKLALDIWKQDKSALLILSGGKKYSDERNLEVSEAVAMKKFIEVQPDINQDEIEIIVEDEGPSSLTQLVIIKTDIILARGLKNIDVISDEIHIERVRVLFDAIMGPGFNIDYQGSLVNIA